MKRLRYFCGQLRYWSLFASMLLLLLCSRDAHAQTWRGTYCVAWNQQIRPTRVIASGHVRAGETVNLIIPPPTLPETIQYVALSWGTDMGMPDTLCTFRVVPASGSYLLQPPVGGATLWEWQIVEVDVRTYDPRNPATPVPAAQGLREMPVPASVQHSITWALDGELLRWLIAVPLGAYLAYQVVLMIVTTVQRWRETPEDGDRDWEQYNAERGIAYDEESGEFVRVDRV